MKDWLLSWDLLLFTLSLLFWINFSISFSGIIYDVIIEPPSVGSTTDEHGHSRPVAFMPYRVNGQYIMEGLASSFLFCLGGLGFVILDHTHSPTMPKLNRILLIAVGFISIIVSFIACWVFMRMKLPWVSLNNYSIACTSFLLLIMAFIISFSGVKFNIEFVTWIMMLLMSHLDVARYCVHIRWATIFYILLDLNFNRLLQILACSNCALTIIQVLICSI